MAAWIGFVDGAWNTLPFWIPNNVPNSAGETASFAILPSSGSGTADIDLGSLVRTVGHLDLVSNQFGRYRIFGGTVSMDNGASNATIDVGVTGSGTPRVSEISGGLRFTSHTVVTVTGTNAALDLKGVVSGAGGWTKSGSGTVNLFNVNNAWTGGLNMSAGSVVAKAADVLSGGIDFSGNATLDLGGFNQSITGLTGTATGAKIVNNGVSTAQLAVFDPSAAFDTNFAGDIQDGSASLGLALFSITGSRLVLTGDNTYSGATTIAIGNTLQIGNGGATGTIGSGNILISNLGQLVFNRTGALTVAGDISGSGGLTKAGAGTVKLSGANSYTGATIINAGVLQGGAPEGFSASSAVTVNAGGTLDIFGFSQTIKSLTGSGTVTSSLGATGVLAATIDSNTIFSGAMVNSGTGVFSFNKLGAAVLTLAGANTYTGTTTVSAGTLRIGNNGASGTIGAGLVINASEVVFARSNNFNVFSDLSGAGVYRKLGAASTLTLADDNNTFTGLFEVEAGTLKGGIANAFSASGGINVNAGATVDLGGFNQTVAGLQGSGTLTNSGVTAATLTQSSALETNFGGVIANGIGVVNLVKSGTGKLILTGENTYTGATTINGGALQISNTGSLGGGNILNNASLIFAQSDDDLFGGVISGNGALSKIGAGLLILTGNNTYSGTTTISAGTLQVGNGAFGNFGSGAVVNNATLILNRSDAVTVSNAISGTGTLRKQGLGVTTLTGVNTYTGTTLIEEGVLKGGAANVTLFSNNMEINSGAKFDLGGFNQSVSGRVTGGGNIDNSGVTAASFTVNVALEQSGIVGGVISDTGGNLTLVKNGDGALTLSGVNTYAGGTVINGGTLSISGTGSFNPLSTGAITNNGLLNLNKSGSLTLNNLISGGGVVNKTNGNTVTLTAANTYTGGTTIEAGTLQIGNGGTTGAAGFGAIEIGFGDPQFSDAILAFNRSDAVTVSNLITGSGNVVSKGSGVLTLTAANSFTGFLRIEAGVLKAGAANIFASAGEIDIVGGVLDLAGFDQTIGSFLDGAGGITNSAATAATLTFDTPVSFSSTFDGVISNSGGALSIVKNGLGVHGFSADNTYSGTTTINAGAIEIRGPGVTSGLGSGDVINNALLDFIRLTDFTVANNITGSGAVVKSSTATMTLLGANAYGVTTINGGKLRVGDGGTTGTLGNLGVTNNAALEFNRSDTITVSNVISGAGALTQAGSGDLRIAGVNTFTGDTIVQAGRLSLAATGSLAASASIVVRIGAVFDISATPVETTIRNLDNAGTVELGGKTLFMSAQKSDLDGVINGSAGVDALNIVMDGADIALDLDLATFTNWTDGVDEITLKGNALDNFFTGSAQADSLNGLGGADTMRGGLGADSLSGGDDDDRFDYFASAELTSGELIQGDGGFDTILLGGAQSFDLGLATISGVETLSFSGTGGGAILTGGQIGASAISAIDATLGSNSGLTVRGAAINLGGVFFTGWNEATNLISLEGAAAASSAITGSSLKESIAGGSQADVLNGGGGGDNIVGSGGADVIDGGTGADTMTGGNGSDTYFVDDANDIVVETAGGGTVDTVNTTLNAYTLTADVERLAFTGAGNFTGRGNALANRLTGGSGNDRFFAEAGDADEYLGGDGVDEVSYRALAGVTIDFVTGVHGGAALGDSFGAIEAFNGSSSAADTMIAGSIGRRFFGNGGDDTLTGGNGNDILNGGDGADTLNGGGFADNLTGGLGADTLTGGGGRDNFIYKEAAFGADVVTDFEDGVDRLWFDSAVAQKFSDFTIDGNGGTTVTVTLGAETLTLNSASGPITLTETDFVFF